MSEVGFIEKSTLEAIGSAVRNKEGTTDLIPVNTLADRIAALPSGVSKLPQVIDRTVTEITAEDLAGVTIIGDYAFYGSPQLKSVAIPNSVTWIKQSAFKDCTSLTSVTIPDSVTSIGEGAFKDCTSLTSATVGNGVKSIGEGAFYRCKNLSAISLGNNVKTIGSYVFTECDTLQYVTLPASITSLDAYVFRKDKQLNKWMLTFLGTTPPSIKTNTFFNIATDFEKIIVPKGCGEAYKTATNWANFADYIEEATE